MVQVTKLSSLTIAAWNLHVTKSTSSQPIASLEKELRLKFFNRSWGHGAVPTDKGRISLILVFGVLRKLEETKETANLFNSTKVGELKISSSPGLMTLLVKAIVAFRHDYPYVTLQIQRFKYCHVSLPFPQ
ncbi:LysR family transcriptional regulator [Bacillus rhizoplanae]|uniref:LysR family transcriptional regulator n=1 Tax=Bacillus rhizoplanae TaxID=2880966 RepID=UPI00267483B7|nr:LysR family transcriptional regulator [Bacillus rhizoplanae]